MHPIKLYILKPGVPFRGVRHLSQSRCAHICVHDRRPTMAMTAEEIRYPDIYLEASVPAQRRSPEKSERGDPSFSSFERYFDIRGGSSGETRGQGQSASTSGANALAAQVKELQVRGIHTHADRALARPLSPRLLSFFAIIFPRVGLSVRQILVERA